MNLHLPQTEEARAEALVLMGVSRMHDINIEYPGICYNVLWRILLLLNSSYKLCSIIGKNTLIIVVIYSEVILK